MGSEYNRNEMSEESKLFRVWLLEGVAYELCQAFITIYDGDSCPPCLLHLMGTWSHLVNLLPNVNEEARLSHWAVMSSLIMYSYTRKELQQLEEMVHQVEKQKGMLRIPDNVSSPALGFLHTMISMHHFDNHDIRKARQHMHKHNVLYAEQMNRLFNVKTDATIPDELQIRSLHCHLRPYITAVVHLLGKPRFFQAAAIIQRKNNEFNYRELIDKLVASETVQNSVVHDEIDGRDALPLCGDVGISCSEVTSSCENVNVVNVVNEKETHRTNSTPSKTMSLLHNDCSTSPVKSKPPTGDLHKETPIDNTPLKSSPAKAKPPTGDLHKETSIDNTPLKSAFKKPLMTYSSKRTNSGLPGKKTKNNVDSKSQEKSSFQQAVLEKEGNVSVDSDLPGKSNLSLQHSCNSKIQCASKGSVKRKCDYNTRITSRPDESAETLCWSSDEETDPAVQVRQHKDTYLDRKTKHAHTTNTKKAKKIIFSEDEENYLREGVNMYGIGSWRQILNAFPFHESRTNVSIKDKYRTMVRHGLI